MCACVCVSACVCVCVCVCMHACVHAHVCACVFVSARGKHIALRARERKERRGSSAHPSSNMPWSSAEGSRSTTSAILCTAQEIERAAVEKGERARKREREREGERKRGEQRQTDLSEKSSHASRRREQLTAADDARGGRE